MKMIAMLLLLNGQTGDIDGYFIAGMTANVATCNDANRAATIKLAAQVPEGDLVAPLCIDASKIDLKELQHLPTEQPPMVSHF